MTNRSAVHPHGNHSGRLHQSSRSSHCTRVTVAASSRLLKYKEVESLPPHLLGSGDWLNKTSQEQGKGSEHICSEQKRIPA